MGEFNLSNYPDEILKELKKQVDIELNSRFKLSSCRIKIAKSISDNQSIKSYRKDIEKRNAEGLLSIPGHRDKKFMSCSFYLPSLINQDWSGIYYGGDKEEKYYVYAHINPTKPVFITTECCGGNYGGTPFYIGKGSDLRAYDLNRNQGHGKVLKSLLSDGFNKDEIVKILFSELTEAKAYEIEAKVIYFFGTVYDKTIKKNGCLYNLTIPKLPLFTGDMENNINRSWNKMK